MRHSEAKHPGGLMVDDNSNLADCTTPRLGVGAALRPLGRTHDAFDHHGRDAREHGLGHRGCQDVGNRTDLQTKPGQLRDMLGGGGAQA